MSSKVTLVQWPTVGTGRLDGLDDAGLLAHLVQVVRRLGAAPLSGALDDEALTASVAALHRAETMVAAEKLRRIGEVEARKAYLGKAMSTADWAASRLGLTRGEAKTAAATATALAELPATAAKLADGHIGVGQAAVAARALDDLHHSAETADAEACEPADAAAAAEAARAALDALVAEHAGGEDRSRLRRRIDDWHARNRHSDVLGDRQRRAFARRHAWLGADPGDGDGMLRLEARLDAVSGATVRAALEPLARPTQADDPRTAGQRLADALVALAEMALNHGDLPQTAVARPHVLLITTPNTLHGAEDADPSLLDGVGPIAADTARQVCCDADITPIVVGRNGEILNVGRSRRVPTAAQRKAVIARDQHCVGCAAPAARCQIHHITWWRHHGTTNLDNLTLLCWTCHHNVHHNNWTITRQPDGRYTANPPDRPQRPDPPDHRHSP